MITDEIMKIADESFTEGAKAAIESLEIALKKANEIIPLNYDMVMEIISKIKLDNEAPRS